MVTGLSRLQFYPRLQERKASHRRRRHLKASLDGPPDPELQDCMGNFGMWKDSESEPREKEVHISTVEFNTEEIYFMMSHVIGP